jgi:DNA-binding HxlR family transcriptional regulator
MHRYGQYCPVARAAEILADRWTVLIVRELLADIDRFNELERGLPHMSRALLVERLRRLERAGVLERQVLRGKHTQYRLTPAGRELQQLIEVLGGWERAGRSVIRARMSSIQSSFCGGCVGGWRSIQSRDAAW